MNATKLWMEERSMRSVRLAVLGLVALAGLAQGGVITFSPPLTTDLASGINPNATYTHKISGGQTATVNTVGFAVVDPSTTPPNTNWNTFTWTKNEVENNNNNWSPAAGGVTGTGLQELFGDFAYSGNGTAPGNHQAYTLSGLTPGTTYDMRVYVRAWDVNYTGRLATLTYTNGAEVDSTLISEDQPTVQGYPSSHSAYYINYSYTAQGASMTLDAAVAAGGGGSFHMYALSNQVAGPVPPFMVTNTAAGSTGFTVSATDLIEGLLPTVNDLNLIRTEEGATTNNPGALTNGAFGNPGIPGGPTEIVAIHNGAILTYVLDTLTSPAGYAITEIDTYTGWRDAGRDAQQYNVLYSLVSNPSVFLALASASYNPANGGPADTAVQFLMSDGISPLISDVAAIRFEFPSTENGYVGYREIDVFGEALTIIPEPTSLGILVLGGLGLLARRRRRRSTPAARAGVACLAVLALCSLLGTAEATIVLYSDDFSGTAPALLNGTAPDVRPGSQTWTARTDASLWYAGGTKTATGSSHAWLPFTPTAGYLYTLSLDVNPVYTAGNSDWFALGFSASNIVNNSFHDGANAAVGWMLNRSDDASASVIQTFRGTTTANGASHDLNPDVVGWLNLKVVLDTQPANWSVQWWAGTSLLRSDTFPSVPTINYIGFGSYANTTGAVDNFSLTRGIQSTPPSFLRRHYPLDDNAADTTVLNTVSAPQATYVGANTDARHAAGLLGTGALSLNGTSDYIKVDDTADLNFPATPAGAFTVLGWLKTTDLNGMLLSFRTQGGSGNPLIEVGVWNGRPYGQIRDDNGGGLQTLNPASPTINDDAWHHVAVRRRPDGFLEVYADGILVATSGGACTGPITTSIFRDLGSEQRWVADNANSADQRFLGGLVDDVGIWAAALSPQEIALVHGLGLFAGDTLESPDLAAMLAAYDVQTAITLANNQLWQYMTNPTWTTTGAVGGSILTNDAYIVLSGTLHDGMQFLAVVPEPATLTLLALGGLGLLRRRRALGR